MNSVFTCILAGLAGLMFVGQMTGCTLVEKYTNPQSEAGELSTAQFPPERTSELEVADVELREFELEGSPLYVMFDIIEIEQDDLNILPQLNRGVRNVLSDQLVKVERPGQKRSIQQYREEIKRAEAKGGEGYTGSQIVNYLMTGRLELSSLRTRYEPPSFTCTLRKDDCLGICEYEVRARLSLEVEKFPELRRLDKWILETSASDSFPVKDQCPTHNLNNPHPVFPKLVDKIADRMISCSRAPMEDFFVSQAYITNYYSDGQRFWFVTSGGRAAGFEKGDDVVVERLDHFSQGSESGSMDGTYRTVAKAEIVKLYDKHSVIAVENQAIANQLKVHDRVRLKPSRLIPNVFCSIVLKN